MASEEKATEAPSPGGAAINEASARPGPPVRAAAVENDGLEGSTPQPLGNASTLEIGSDSSDVS
jgi:hypothetical protein